MRSRLYGYVAVAAVACFVGYALCDSAYGDPYPMFGHDAQHTNYVPVPAPLVEPDVLWTATTGASDLVGGIAMSPVVDDAGNTFAAFFHTGNDVEYMVAIDRFGVETWRAGISAPGANLSSPLLVSGDLTWFIQQGWLVSLNQETGAVNWAVYLGGRSISSPVVDSAGNIYVGGRQDGGFYKVDSATGAVIWEYVVTGGASSSPALSLDEGTVYIGRNPNSTSPGLHAIDAATGALKWIFNPPGTDLGWTSPMVGADGTIYQQEDFTGILHALQDDGTSYTEKWSFDPLNYSEPPRIAATDGNTIYVICNTPEHTVVALNPDGTEQWRTLLGANTTWVSAPLVTDEAVYIVREGMGDIACLNKSDGSFVWQKQVATTNSWLLAAIGIDGMLHVTASEPLADPTQPGVIALRQTYPGLADSAWPMLGKDAQHSGNTDRLGPLSEPWVKWEAHPGIPYAYCWSQPVLDEDGNLYVTVGQASPVAVADRGEFLFSYDSDGVERWQNGPLPTRGPGLSIPAVSAYSNIIAGLRYGAVAAFERTGGLLLGSVWVGENMISSPAIAQDGYLYVGGRKADNGFYKVSPVDGSIVWKHALDTGTAASPALSLDQSTVYAAGNEPGDINTLHAIDAWDGTVKWTFTLTGSGGFGWASPVVGPDGTIYQEDSDAGVMHALVDNGASYTEKWSFDTARPGDSPRAQAVDDDTVYIATVGPDALVYALDFNGVVKWNTMFPGVGLIGVPVVTDEAVYVILEDGLGGRVVGLNADTGAVLWDKQVGSSDASASELTLGDNGVLYCAMYGTDTHPDETTVFALAPNNPPIADAGSDQTLEATSADGASVDLDGSASSDPDSAQGDSLTFEWLEGGDVIATGETAQVTLPLGTHAVVLRVTDSRGATDEDTVEITVQDTTAPTLSLSASPHCLFPPNHKMADIAIAATIDDDGDSAPVLTLLSVTNNEGDDMVDGGDGNTTHDIQNVELGTADVAVSLRSERRGNGDGRIYELTYRVTDASGNSTVQSVIVDVPHDASGHVCDNPDCDLNNSN